MNICLLLISDGWGGAEAVVYELAKHLRDKGENVSLILNQEINQYFSNIVCILTNFLLNQKYIHAFQSPF